MKQLSEWVKEKINMIEPENRWKERMHWMIAVDSQKHSDLTITIKSLTVMLGDSQGFKWRNKSLFFNWNFRLNEVAYCIRMHMYDLIDVHKI